MTKHVRLTDREQELYDFPLMFLLQEAVDLQQMGMEKTSWYFLLLWASLGGHLDYAIPRRLLCLMSIVAR